MSFYACLVCKKTSSSRNELNEHLSSAHPELFWQCPLCPTKLRNNSGNIARHNRLNHVHGYICPHCESPHDTQFQLDRHILYAHTDDSFKCTEDGCIAAYRSQDALNLHLKDKHTNTFHCEKCAAPFQQASLLKAHIMTAHQEDRPFKCRIEGCIAAFKYDSAIAIHMRKHHSDSKSIKCDYHGGCTESFFSKSLMYEHKLSDHYPPDLVCCECHLKFDWIVNFDDHYQDKHATIAEKIAFSTDESKRWFYKLYFIKSLTNNTFKIGITRRPLQYRLYTYNKDYPHALVSWWTLPLNCIINRCYAHQLENKVHLSIARAGFASVGNSREYFTFRSSSVDETSILCNIIEEQLFKNDFTEPLRLAPNKSQNKIYLVYSEVLQLGKIGYTTQPMRMRLPGINKEIPGGNFVLIDEIRVDDTATIHELKAWESDVLIRMHECFGLVKHEYFYCPPEDLEAALGLFQMIDLNI